ncbi:MAG TPA: hypothetical protein VML75_16170 [Kofleriaceae bacterium]|nr:hypothetical protein [Kofleriaceae bacterium]
MKLGLGQVGGDRLELDFSRDDLVRRIALRGIGGLSGTLMTRPTAIDVGPATLDSLTVERATWETEHARLIIDSPAAVSGARVDLEFPRGGAGGGITGTITASGFERAIVSVEAGGRRTTTELAARALTYRGETGGAVVVTAGELSLHEVQTMLGGLLVRVASVEMSGVSAELGEARTIDIANIRVPHVELSGALMDATVRGLELTGVRYRDGAIEVDDVRVESIELAVDLTAHAVQPAAEAEAPKPTYPIDLRVLDQLNGRVSVNLELDVSVPVIGRRKATHRFRLGIENGTVDFAQIEQGLASLENAFIDFAVRGDTLVLERDIPLIPGDRKPIVTWALDEPGEPELAARKRVRLRRLSRYVLAGKKPAGDGKSAGGLQALVLGDIDLELSMSAAQAAATPDAAAHELEGWIRRAELEVLRATGGIRHAPDREPEPGLLELTATGFELELANLPAGRATLDRATARADTIESVRIAFTGLRPDALQARLRGLSMDRARVTLPGR